MATRRSRGDGGLHWDDKRQRWIATVTIGHDSWGKRLTRRASGKTKTEAKAKLKEILQNYDDGLTAAAGNYTVGDAVAYWLTYGLSARAPATVQLYRICAETHIIPAIGKRKLRELTVEDIEKFYADRSADLSTRSLRIIHSILSRAMKRAQARDKVRRNVVLLCEVPTGRAGRPSKSLTLDQAEAMLKASELSWLHPYIVVSLLTGARTEELRALRWDHVVAFDETSQKWRPVTGAGWEHGRFAVYVWRSDRAGGDTKTRKSRRTLALAQRGVIALKALWGQRRCEHAKPAECDCQVFVSPRAATPLDAHNVRRESRKVAASAGLNPKEWTPRELRHSFVSVMSDAGVPLESISRLVGHDGTRVTEAVYRKQLRPVMDDGATVMDRIFPASEPER